MSRPCAVCSSDVSIDEGRYEGLTFMCAECQAIVRDDEQDAAVRRLLAKHPRLAERSAASKNAPPPGQHAAAGRRDRELITEAVRVEQAKAEQAEYDRVAFAATEGYGPEERPADER